MPEPPVSPTMVCDDGVVRPTWAARSPLARTYFDTEWGRPVRSESGLLELLVMFGFAGGLTWASVLARRAVLAEVFHGYDADRLSGWTDVDVERALQRADMIRNRRKIDAAVQNSRATRALRAGGGLGALVWAATDRSGGPPVDLVAIPMYDDESTRIADELRSAGFTRIGPVSVQALRLACGALPVRREFLTSSGERSTG